MKLFFPIFVATVLWSVISHGKVECEFSGDHVKGHLSISHNIVYKVDIVLEKPNAQTVHYEKLDFFVMYRAEALQVIQNDPFYAPLAKNLNIDPRQLAAIEAYTAYSPYATVPYWGHVRFVNIDGQTLAAAGEFGNISSFSFYDYVCL